MDSLSDDEIRGKIARLNTIDVLALTEQQCKLLNDFEAELLRHHPERNTAPQAGKDLLSPIIFLR